MLTAIEPPAATDEQPPCVSIETYNPEESPERINSPRTLKALQLTGVTLDDL